VAKKKAARPSVRPQQIAELRAQGLTFEKIGKRLGITKQCVHTTALKAVVPIRQRRSAVRCAACNEVITSKVLQKAASCVVCLSCLAKQPDAPFSVRLKAYRVAAGLDRAELAKLTGLSVAYLTLHEEDGKDISLSKAIRLAAVLGVGVLGIDELLERSGTGYGRKPEGGARRWRTLRR
jgi:transcriptional regulator with XRE-family HTH domain